MIIVTYLKCGKLVKTIESVVKPCLCEFGHAGGCNPFSPNPYMAGIVTPKTAAEKPAEDWSLREGDKQCVWQGAVSRCILRLGHFPSAPHKEMETHLP